MGKEVMWLQRHGVAERGHGSGRIYGEEFRLKEEAKKAEGRIRWGNSGTGEEGRLGYVGQREHQRDRWPLIQPGL